jgi:hypothetical protein
MINWLREGEKMGKIVEQKNIIEELVQKLTINDVKDVGEYEEEPDYPQQVMDDLVKMGEPATKELLKLLKNTLKYSSYYAVTVLSEMKSVDSIAIESLLSLLSDEEFLYFGDGWERAISALQKIGLPALQPVLGYLEEQKKKNNVEGIIFALQILSKIKAEQSFVALADSISYPNDEVKMFAVDYLVDFGDKRASLRLAKLFDDPEWAEDKDNLKHKIRNLSEPDEYRRIFQEHGFIGLDRMKSFQKELEKLTQEMTSAYGSEKEFEGIDADKLNDIKRELPIKEALELLFDQLVELAVDETIISKKTYRQLENISNGLRKQRTSYRKKYEEELGIIEWHYFYRSWKGESERSYFYHENFVTEEKRGFKSLTPQETHEPSLYDRSRFSVVSVFTKTLQDWLQEQDFLITMKGGTIIARRGSKSMRQGCFVDIKDAPFGWEVEESMRHLRRYKLVDLTLWGKGWTDDSKSSFLKSFWEFVGDAVLRIVGKKRYNKIILQDCTKCGQTWLQSELDHGLCIYHRKAENS